MTYKGRMALAHNGNLTNSQELRAELESKGSIFHTTTDSEVIAYIIVFYAALGTTLGHNYPVWQRFHGGKGVATSCAGYFLYMPLQGLLSMIAGMLVVFATQYLGLGAVVIAFCYIPFAFVCGGTEAGAIAVILAVLMMLKHFPAVRDIFTGKAEKVNVLGAIREKLQKR